MRIKYLLIAVAILLLPLMASAQGPPPDVANYTTFQGTVTINGAAATDGTCITASGGGGGTDCPGSEGGGTKNGMYSVSVLFQGTNETVTFSVNGNTASPTWPLTASDKGKTITLNLAVTSGGGPGGGGSGTGTGGGTVTTVTPTVSATGTAVQPTVSATGTPTVTPSVTLTPTGGPTGGMLGWTYALIAIIIIVIIAAAAYFLVLKKK